MSLENVSADVLLFQMQEKIQQQFGLILMAWLAGKSIFNINIIIILFCSKFEKILHAIRLKIS